MQTKSSKQNARLIFDKMMQKDQFSKWLGLQLDDINEGSCKMHFTLLPEMANGFGSAHGGILFAASDSVFAFACNSHGLMSVAMEASIHFLRPVLTNEKLYIKAELIFLGNRTGLYEVKSTNEKGELVCVFKGTAHRTKKTILE